MARLAYNDRTMPNLSANPRRRLQSLRRPGVWTILLPACAAFFITEKPLALVTIATWLAAFAMAFYCPILAYVTRRLLPEELRPSWVHTLWLLIGAAFYWGLILISLSMGAHP